MIQRNIRLAVLILSTLISLRGFAAPAHPLAVQATFHVMPSGNDDNPGTEGQPFATIEKARQAVRAVNKEMVGDIVVVLHGGAYTIERTIRFDGADSGTGGHNVIYRAATNETPIISGGKPVIGWQPDEKGRWKAPAPVQNFRQLYIAGRRAVRACGPAPAGIQLVDNEAYTTTDVVMAGWRNPQDIELCYNSGDTNSFWLFE
jgi:hypothetical protein